MKHNANRISELRSEYHFDYSKGRPNRFARHLKSNSGLVVLIDADVAKIFKTPQAVNHALRALADALPPIRHKRVA